jgi:hypothetical protein
MGFYAQEPQSQSNFIGCPMMNLDKDTEKDSLGRPFEKKKCHNYRGRNGISIPPSVLTTRWPPQLSTPSLYHSRTNQWPHKKIDHLQWNAQSQAHLQSPRLQPAASQASIETEPCQHLSTAQISEVEKAYYHDPWTLHELRILKNIHEHPETAQSQADRRIRYTAKASLIGWKAVGTPTTCTDRSTQLSRDGSVPEEQNPIHSKTSGPCHFLVEKATVINSPKVPLVDRLGKPIWNPKVYLQAIQRNAPKWLNLMALVIPELFYHQFTILIPNLISSFHHQTIGLRAKIPSHLRQTLSALSAPLENRATYWNVLRRLKWTYWKTSLQGYNKFTYIQFNPLVRELMKLSKVSRIRASLTSVRIRLLKLLPSQKNWGWKTSFLVYTSTSTGLQLVEKWYYLSREKPVWDFTGTLKDRSLPRQVLYPQVVLNWSAVV